MTTDGTGPCVRVCATCRIHAAPNPRAAPANVCPKCGHVSCGWAGA